MSFATSSGSCLNTSRTEESLPLPHEDVHHAMQAELASLRAQLQTQQAENQRLRAHCDQAKEAKSAFLSSMSHEIRTPLNAVLGFAQIGSMNQADAAAARHFGQILQAGRHLLGLLNDVLDFAEIDAGHLSLHWGDVRLGACIDEAMDAVREQASAKGLQLVLMRQPQVAERWHADAKRLTQILACLLGNAVKFTMHGEVRLTVASDAQGLHLQVRDTGPGMSEELIARSFDPFEQGDGGLTRLFGGAGLGLSICKRLVELMGGCIQATSQAGQGCCFDVRLPLRALDVAPPQGGAHDDANPAALAGKHVLVAEDHQVNQLLLEQLLLNVGVQITMVDNGREAVEAVRKAGPGHFDLLLCDVEMPEMDGLQATARVRELDPGLPVLGLTAHAFEQARAKGLRAGMADYIVKPFVYADLVRLMARHVRRPV